MKREVADGEIIDIDSLLGTAVRDELSEENMLDAAVWVDAADRMLIWSIDLRGCEESVVEKESYVLWLAALLPDLADPHCCSFVPRSPG